MAGDALLNQNFFDKAVAECNFQKGLGPDEFDSRCIKEEQNVNNNFEIRKLILNALNSNKIPDYLKEAKLIL